MTAVEGNVVPVFMNQQLGNMELFNPSRIEALNPKSLSGFSALTEAKKTAKEAEAVLGLVEDEDLLEFTAVEEYTFAVAANVYFDGEEILFLHIVSAFRAAQPMRFAQFLAPVGVFLFRQLF
jgi:hypothetical protein